MTEKDEIFKFYSPKELSTVDKSRYSHFGWEGKGPFAFLTLVEAYKNGADAIFEKFTSSRGDFAILDTLVYPLCFMYRHCMEILIKYLYIKYSEGTESDLKSFLNFNHGLNKVWQKVKPILSTGKERVGSDINIGAIEHYIKEMDKFDPISMRMRYPVNKKLEPQNPTVWLDIYNLHERMDDFFNSIEQIDYDIDYQVKVQAPVKDRELYLKMYNSARDKVLEFIKLMSEFSGKEKEVLEEKSVVEMLRDSNDESGTKISYLNRLSDDNKIIIETLYYTGGNARGQSLRLPLSPKDKIADFVTSCLSRMQMDGLEFGKKITEGDINVYSKSSSSIVENLKTAIDILG